MPKSWRDKLADDKDFPKVGKIPPKLHKSWGKGTMVIVRPRDVDAIMRKVPRGKVITIKEICQKLAKQHQVDVTCPITTGIFAWIAAHAAEEAAMEGVKEITPYWRTLKGEGELNPKYPGGIERCRQLLEDEGHTVVAKGKRYLVQKRKLITH